jgi:Ca2+-binding RTX toxin-like protein/pimeloyl-ACP methyl ester carboxylesterase
MSDGKFYTIDVKTAPVGLFGPWLTGTRHDVEVKLKGTNGTTDYIDLVKHNDVMLGQGSNNTFYLGWHDIGNLKSLEFKLNGDLQYPFRDNWALDDFSVHDGNNYFHTPELIGTNNHFWLSKDQRKEFSVESGKLAATGNEFDNLVKFAKSAPDKFDGSNDVINGVWFHVMDTDGTRDGTGTINKNQDTHFVIHGFNDGTGTEGQNQKGIKEWQKELGKAINKEDQDANVVLVDWKEKNFDIHLYPWAVGNLDTVSEDIVRFIENNNLQPEKIKLYGHSLGAQISGRVGQKIKEKQGKEIAQIVGMDTAGPLFESKGKDTRLSDDDAKDVFTIHTSEFAGFDAPHGDFDLYLNADYESWDGVDYFHPMSNAIPFVQHYHSYAKDFLEDLFNGEVDKHKGKSLKGVENITLEKFFDPNSYSSDTAVNNHFPNANVLFYNEELTIEDEIAKLGTKIVEEIPIFGQLTGLIFGGPLADSYVFFDTNRNLTWDEGEVSTKTNKFGLYSLDISEQNVYTDLSKGVWNGEKFVPDEEQTVDFRDGLIVAVDSLDGSKSESKDIITGKNYGIPLINVPGEMGKDSNPSIISTLKATPVLLWNDKGEAPAWAPTEDRHYEKLTPEYATSKIVDDLKDIPEKLLEDDYDPYAELGQGNSGALDSMAYTYQMVALLLTTAELFEKLERDGDIWSADVETYPALAAIRAFGLVLQAKDGEIGPARKELWDSFAYDWDSLDITNSQQIAEAWEYIFNIQPTKLGTEETFFTKNGLPIDQESVLEKVKELPLEWIAEGLAQVQDQFNTILESAGEKDSRLVIPAIAGPKRLFLTELVENIVDIAFESQDENEYQEKLSSVLSKPTYVNYDVEDLDDEKTILVATSNNSSDVPTVVENVVVPSGEKLTKSFEIYLSEPAPLYGLTVRYQIGGDAVEGEDYKHINSSDNNLYGSFFIPPGAERHLLDFEIDGDSIDGDYDLLQLKLLTADSGYTMNSDYQSATFVISQEPVVLEEGVQVEEVFAFAPTSEAVGDSGDNELKVDDGVHDPIFIGGEGSDRFFLNPNVKGVTHFSNFNLGEDKIVVSPGDFPNATAEDFTIVGGTLFYQDQPLALISNKIDGEEKAYSYYSKVPIVIEDQDEEVNVGDEETETPESDGDEDNTSSSAVPTVVEDQDEEVNVEDEETETLESDGDDDNTSNTQDTPQFVVEEYYFIPPNNNQGEEVNQETEAPKSDGDEENTSNTPELGTDENNIDQDEEVNLVTETPGTDGDEENTSSTQDGLEPGIDPNNIENGTEDEPEPELDQVIRGNNSNDTIDGNKGNDTVYANAGLDFVNGDDGDDMLHGGKDADLVLGGMGKDTLFGDMGNDLLEGNEGSDLLYGGQGDDTLYGDDMLDGGTDDDLVGSIGKDTLFGDMGDDMLDGGKDDDLVLGGIGEDTVLGDMGDDMLHGGKDDDLVLGGIGKDTVLGEVGNDLLEGNEDDDLLYGGQGDDTLRGGEGSDSFVLAPGNGSDIIQDFEDGIDLLQLDGGLAFENLTLIEESGITVITFGNQRLALVSGVASSLLTREDFLIPESENQTMFG